MSSIEVNGVSIEYEERGDPAGPVVLMIQGLGMQLIAWPEDMVRVLVEAGYRVILFDNRDAGLSTHYTSHGMPNPINLSLRKLLGLKNEIPYTLEDMAEDALGLLDGLKIKQAHIVGVSMGGMISQIFAARYPERTLSLTSMMSSSGRFGYSLPSYKVRLRIIQRPASTSREDRVKNIMGIWKMIGSPAYPRSKESIKAWCERAYDRAYNPGGAVRQIAAIIENGSRAKYLKKIIAPTLVIHGTEDIMVPVRGGIDTARHIKNSRQELVKGMGHDFPEELNEYIAHLLTEHHNAVQQTLPGTIPV